MFKTKKWATLASAIGSLFIVLMIGGNIALSNAGYLNYALNATTSIIIPDENADNVDTEYFKTSIGDGTYSEENLQKFWEDAYEQNINEMKEGAALLKNENDALPLKEGAHISLFGHATVQPLYDAMAAGTRVAYAPTHRTDYVTALKNAGFVVNDALVQALENGDAVRGIPGAISVLPPTANGSATGSEENLSFYEAQRSTYANDYRDAAIVMFAREGAEGTDLLMDDNDDPGGSTEKISSLALHKNELDLLKLVREDFDTVIVLLNSPYQLEVEQIEEYSDAILYIGAPGHKGFEGVADILKGGTNPSGHLVDTYAVNSLSAPAVVNSGTRTPEWSNLSEIRAALGDNDDANRYTSNENVERVSVQVENIYIGYRYYETRYADSVYGGRGASAAVGSSNGGAWNYGSEVSYPFGFGLSYTSFEQEITGFSNDENSVSVTVNVTNTGDIPGKSVVQLYTQTPYGQYEIENGVEKSAVQLVGFDKTEILEAGDSQELTITVDKYLLASYDQNRAKGYILSEGEYCFAIGENAHDALNNILAYQGYTTEDGMDADGDAELVRGYRQSFDAEKYKRGENNVIVTNQFESADLNYWQEGKVTYLSRADWENTYPTQQTYVTADEKMIEVLSGKWYMTEDTSSPYYHWSDEAREAPTYEEVASRFKNLGSDLTITIAMMRDVDIDDPVWDEFMYQASPEDMVNGTAESFDNLPVGSLSPQFTVGDGCDSAMARPVLYIDPETGERTADAGMSLRYCSHNICVGTFNKEIIENRGRRMGEDGLWGKQMCIFTSGLNLHRTPFGGRNFEYMSECPTMTYLCSIIETTALEKTGVHAAPKHFCSNDQETQREGVAVFMREQAFREGSLKAFEGAIRFAKVGGLMASFERIGMVYASYHYDLMTTVLRDEWNFRGFNVTDASKNDVNIDIDKGYFNHYNEGFAAGTNQWCFDNDARHGRVALEQAKENNDGYILLKIFESAKYWVHGVATSNIINGMSAGDKIVPVTPMWQTAVRVAQVVSGVLFGAAAALTVVLSVVNTVKKQKGGADNGGICQ